MTCEAARGLHPFPAAPATADPPTHRRHQSLVRTSPECLGCNQLLPINCMGIGRLGGLLRHYEGRAAA